MQHDPMAFTEHRLASGLRVFFQHRPLPFVGCKLMVHGGSRHDPPGKEELMHLLEHMLFSGGSVGRPRMSLVELERWYKAQRWDVNIGETQLDFSAYGGKAAVERFPGLLRFLHALTLEPLLDSDMEKDREIVRREREEAATPEEQETESVRRKAVFGSHRLAAVGGWADDATLDGLTLDDAREAHARFYHPANMTLVVVGGMEEAALLETAERTFAGPYPAYVPQQPQGPPSFGIPDPREHLQRKEGRVTNMEVRYGWYLPPGKRAPLILARNAIDESITDHVRERLRNTYSVTVQDAVMLDHRVIGLATQVAPKKAALARSIIEECLRDVPWIVAQLPRLKAEYELALEFLELSLDETIERAAIAINAAGRPRPVADVRAAVAQTTEDDVRELMASLAPERAFVELIEQ